MQAYKHFCGLKNIIPGDIYSNNLGSALINSRFIVMVRPQTLSDWVEITVGLRKGARYPKLFANKTFFGLISRAFSSYQNNLHLLKFRMYDYDATYSLGGSAAYF